MVELSKERIEQILHEETLKKEELDICICLRITLQISMR